MPCCCVSRGPAALAETSFTYLTLGILSINYHPANFNDLGTVLGDIYSMLVTRGGDVDDAVFFKGRLRGWLLLLLLRRLLLIWGRSGLGSSALRLVGRLLLCGSSSAGAGGRCGIRVPAVRLLLCWCRHVSRCVSCSFLVSTESSPTWTIIPMNDKRARLLALCLNQTSETRNAERRADLGARRRVEGELSTRRGDVETGQLLELGWRQEGPIACWDRIHAHE